MSQRKRNDERIEMSLLVGESRKENSTHHDELAQSLKLNYVVSKIYAKKMTKEDFFSYFRVSCGREKKILFHLYVLLFWSISK